MWTVEEIEKVLEIIAALPRQLVDLDETQIFRMDKSVHDENPATTNYDDVTLYDLAFEHKNSTAQILAHELSHVLYESLPREAKDDFANHIEQYLFRSESLKNKSPESYKWIKKRFGDDFKIQRTK